MPTTPRHARSNKKTAEVADNSRKPPPGRSGQRLILAMNILGVSDQPEWLEPEIDRAAVDILTVYQRERKSPLYSTAVKRLSTISHLLNQLHAQCIEASKEEIDALRREAEIVASSRLANPILDAAGRATTLRWINNERRSERPIELLEQIFDVDYSIKPTLAETARVAAEAESQVKLIYQRAAGKSRSGDGRLSERLLTATDNTVHLAGYLLHRVGRTAQITATTDGLLSRVSSGLWTYSIGLPAPLTLGKRAKKLAPGLRSRLTEGRWFGNRQERD